MDRTQPRTASGNNGRLPHSLPGGQLQARLDPGAPMGHRDGLGVEVSPSLPLPASLESMYTYDWLLPWEGVGSVLPAPWAPLPMGPADGDCPGLCTGGSDSG